MESVGGRTALTQLRSIHGLTSREREGGEKEEERQHRWRMETLAIFFLLPVTSPLSYEREDCNCHPNPLTANSFKKLLLL